MWYVDSTARVGNYEIIKHMTPNMVSYVKSYT